LVNPNIHKGEWMEAGDDPALSPTVFLIEQSPGYVLETHFHRNNQFQLIVDGDGKLGPSAVEPVTVHYAGAYTGYGPLVPNERGLKYFTIRAVCESGALYLSQCRDQMRRGPKRHATSQPIHAPAADDLARLSGPVQTDVIAVGADGMGARLVNLPPGAAAATPFPEQALGGFAFVLSGSLLHAGGRLDAWESVFASHAGELPALTAGPQGASVVFLFIPPKEAVYC
jgi:hypothetical protein